MLQDPRRCVRRIEPLRRRDGDDGNPRPQQRRAARGGMIRLLLHGEGTHFHAALREAEEETARAGLRTAGREVIRDQPKLAAAPHAARFLDDTRVEQPRPGGHPVPGKAGRQSRRPRRRGASDRGKDRGEFGGGGVARDEMKDGTADFRGAADIGGDDGQASGESFEVREAQALVGAGGDERIARGENEGHVARAAGPVYATADAAACDGGVGFRDGVQ